MSEEWRSVIGYEGIYEVSDQGRVKRIKKGQGAQAGKILSPKLSAGYPAVSLYRNGHRNNIRVHTLVLEAFVGPAPRDHVANHRDGDRTNNNIENLEWVTWAENRLHAMHELGHMFAPGFQPAGEDSAGAKLTEKVILEIRKRYAEGKTQCALAQQYNVGQACISQIVNRRTWKHI